MGVEWGPMWALVGDWEGESDLDAAFSHSSGEVVVTPHRARVSFTPFGPFAHTDRNTLHRVS